MLFDAPIITYCPQNFQNIKNTLQAEVKNCQHLIIWTDGDREGENIGFEVIQVCQEVKPNVQVHRARFSEITLQAISRACTNLCLPDQRVNDAVNVRRELDLRIGAAFTRFQTLRLKRVFPQILSDQLISYGSCQFPTLGFVVERYKQVKSFIPEPFWKLKVTHKKEETVTEFSWKRGRLFDHTACLALYQMCLEDPLARVVDVRSRPKSKWRPQPMDTVELEKLASRKLHINAKETMTIAEKLYTKGFISYPRTETTIFPKELNLVSLVQHQVEDPVWGEFARGVLESGPNPRQGNKTDKAHPPIHPTKYASLLQGNDKRIYELVVRHFLACVSKDAEGKETTIEITVKDERFAVNGLMIIARNYLNVYPYERWNAKVIGEYHLHEEFQPFSVEMNEGETSAPQLLTEADLIALMEKHGIGTDATHAEHIETIKSRLYVGVNETGHFIPGELGMGLVEGYDLMGFQMSKPHLRAELEADLKRICEGHRDPQVVLREQISKYKEYFIEAARQAIKIDIALSEYFNVTPNAVLQEENITTFTPIMKCPKCHNGDIVHRRKKDNTGYYLSCLSYPECRAIMWLPQILENIIVTNQDCQQCHPRKVKKLKLKFKSGSLLPFYEDTLTSCLGGCDLDFMEVIGARLISASINGNRSSHSDSGYHSLPTSFSNPRSTPHVQPPTRAPLQPVSSNNDIVCNCGKNAILLTVKKEGINKGRQFYKCPETQCNFFLWQDESAPRSTSSSTSLEVVQCNCPSAAKLLTCKKEGPNKGRPFYVCSKPQGQACSFFKWADETPSSTVDTSFGGPGGSRKRPGTRTSGTKRKCGLCSQTGHNRKNCPQKR